MVSLYIFLANMELAERIEESADDMTAADIAPRPINDTTGGVRCCNDMGSTIEALNCALEVSLS